VIELAYGLRVGEIAVLSIRDMQLCLSVCSGKRKRCAGCELNELMSRVLMFEATCVSPVARNSFTRRQHMAIVDEVTEMQISKKAL
jgi:hypothetical protein